MSEDFELGDLVDSSQVPGWTRREPKWKPLIDLANSLQEGQSRQVIFEDKHTADRARNTVREAVNMAAGRPILRTRLVEELDKNGNPTDRYVVYLTRLRESEIVEEVRRVER